MSSPTGILADIITDYMGSVDSIQYEVPEPYTEQVCTILKERGFDAIAIGSSVKCEISEQDFVKRWIKQRANE